MAKPQWVCLYMTYAHIGLHRMDINTELVAKYAMCVIVLMEATKLFFNYANFIPTKHGVFYFFMASVIFIVDKVKVAIFM